MQINQFILTSRARVIVSNDQEEERNNCTNLNQFQSREIIWLRCFQPSPVKLFVQLDFHNSNDVMSTITCFKTITFLLLQTKEQDVTEEKSSSIYLFIQFLSRRSSPGVSNVFEMKRQVFIFQIVSVPCQLAF